jgi:Haem-binding domain
MERWQKEKIMKRWRYILVGLALVLIVMQFIPMDLPPSSNDNDGDIIKSGLVSQDVATLLTTSCYNCHSNETKYPWYSYVAPSSWLIARDVREAREELNFSSWQSYDTTKMLGKLDDITSEVGEGHMPMPIYTFMHPAAKLDDAQRELIVAWAEATMDIVAGDEEEEEENEDDDEDEEEE